MSKSFIRIASALVLLCGNSVAADPSTQPKAKHPSLAEVVSTILGVAETPGSYLDDLAAVVSGPASNLRARDQQIERLVIAVNEGKSSGNFSRMLAETCSVSMDNHPLPKDWRFGTYQSRQELRRLLFARAQLTVKDNPRRAASYARAALILAAHEDFLFGQDQFSGLHEQIDAIGKVAQLSPRQTTELASLSRQLSARDLAHSKIAKQIIEIEDTVFRDKSGEPIPQSLLELHLQSVREQWELSQAGPVDAMGLQLMTIMDVYTFRNLAFARNDTHAVEAVEELLQEWKRSATAEPVARWLDEARVPGPPPTRSRIIRIDGGK